MVRSLNTLLVLLAFFFAAASATAQLTATWTGAGGDNSYSNADNWDTALAPINDLSNTYNVVIPAGATINYDVTGTGNQVDSLALADGSTLVMGSPSLALEVLGTASLAGTINAADGSLTAAALSSSFTGTPHLMASGGGTIHVAAPTFSATYTGTQVIFDADGVGSVIMLNTMDALIVDESTSFTDPLTIRATNGGVIDLSAVESATSSDRLDFVVATGGNIDLPSLLSTSGVRFQIDKAIYSLPALGSSTNTIFDAASGTTLSAPQLSSMSNSTVTLADGAALDTPNLSSFQSSTITLTPTRTFTTDGLVNIDSSRFFLQAGAVFDQVTATSYTGNFSGAQTMLDSNGPGSDLDLSSLTSLTVNENTSFEDVITVRAADGGLIDLSNVTSIQANDLLELEIQTSGHIDLSALTSTQRVLFDIDVTTYTTPVLATAANTRYEVGPAATLDLPMLLQQDGGNITLSADATLNAPSLTHLNNTTFTAETNATFNAPLVTDFAGSTATISPDFTFTTRQLSHIDNARFFVEGGKVFGEVTATSYTGNFSNGSQTLFQADGAGSRLDLSSLTSFEANETTSFEDPLYARAINDGIIDLSSIESAVSSDLLVFEIASSGQIDLSSLISTSRVRFDVDVATFELPSLETAASSQFLVATGATVDAPLLAAVSGSTLDVSDGGALLATNLTSLTDSLATFTASNSIQTAKLINIDGSRFFVEAGGVFDAATATGYTGNFSGEQTIMQATGTGSVLDLSSLSSLVVTENTSFDDPLTVRAADQATIDLSSVANASSNDRLRFVAESNSRIDLGALQSASLIDFHVESGGRIEVGSVSSGDSVNILVTDSDSRFIAHGDVLIDPDSTLSVSNGGVLILQGDYRFEQIDEGNIAFDAGVLRFEGSGVQEMEVAGLDSGVGGATSGNFGTAQLVIGTATERNSVELIDAIDNGNRGIGGEAEALYLYGLGGPTGLKILNGSALVLNGLNVYAWDPIQGQQVHLNSLFGPGELRIPYDDGYVQLVPLDFHWDNSGGGDFQVEGNWSDGVTPIRSDAAVWDLDSIAGYVVLFGANVATDSAAIKTDRVTFDLGGFTYEVAGLHAADSLIVAESSGDEASLTVSNGQLVTNRVLVAPESGSIGQLTISDTGTLQVDQDLVLGSGSATLSVKANGSVAVGGELWLGNSSTLNGSGTVSGEVHNQSGVVAPGDSIGVLSIEGSYDQAADATLAVAIAGDDNSNAMNPEHDQLVIDGPTTIAGTLEVQLVEEYAPALTETFTILASTGGLTGEFSNALLPDLGPLLAMDVFYNPNEVILAVVPALAGDYNADGFVDIADYTVWRNTLGAAGTALAADGDRSGTVDAADYNLWRSNFGNTASSSVGDQTAVPEPNTLLGFALAMTLVGGTYWRAKE
ncbi:hypothetical protein NG895_00245 [Aeoliella sp. ICT_H6.2]|uniref:Secreted protein with PEP-CTERM sorting signal n=1 Tax=Aeoliella straminimaris TaxID=2954799 RepID=A0A9X2F640_9BACT|nr:hypothetical protein [Aeoliella straminimaris]MCO6042323.1 hypothetical protein [Aeoliella straminimaris]